MKILRISNRSLYKANNIISVSRLHELSTVFLHFVRLGRKFGLVAA